MFFSQVIAFIVVFGVTYVSAMFPLASLILSLIFFTLYIAPAVIARDGAVKRPIFKCLLASVVWLLNAGWAWWLSDLVNPIRVDLIVLLPLLLVLTWKGLAAVLRPPIILEGHTYSRLSMKLIAGLGVFVFIAAFVVLGHNKNPKPLFTRLLEGDLGPSGTALIELQSLPASEQETYVPKLIDVLKTGEPNKRLHAVYMLGYLGLPIAAPAIPVLQEALKDPDRDVSEGASRFLTQWNNKEKHK